MLIFDIGVNNGEFSAAALSKYPKAKVIGVDCSPASVSNIPKWLWEDPRFEFVYRAVSDEAGETLDFYLDPTQTGIGTVSKKWITESRFAKGSPLLKPHSGHWNAEPIKVTSITIDDLVESYGKPDYIKMDVEGHEEAALNGLTQKVGTITFEWSEEDMDALLWCGDHLQNLGYEEFAVTAFFTGDKPLGNLLQHDNNGDTYLLEPEHWADFDSIYKQLKEVTDPDRRVTYGMFWAR